MECPKKRVQSALQTGKDIVMPKCDVHQNVEARYFCQQDFHYLCNKCYKKLLIDKDVTFVKNQLTDEFHKWRELKAKAEQIVKGYEQKFKQFHNLILQLRKRNNAGDRMPPQQIAETLKHIYQAFESIVQYCKRGKLKEILSLQIDYQKLSQKIDEIEQRTTIENMVSQFLKPLTISEQIDLNNNLTVSDQIILVKIQMQSKVSLINEHLRQKDVEIQQLRSQFQEQVLPLRSLLMSPSSIQPQNERSALEEIKTKPNSQISEMKKSQNKLNSKKSIIRPVQKEEQLWFLDGNALSPQNAYEGEISQLDIIGALERKNSESETLPSDTKYLEGIYSQQNS